MAPLEEKLWWRGTFVDPTAETQMHAVSCLGLTAHCGDHWSSNFSGAVAGG
jgi:hypothetical protein